jgi:geranylgeranyl diphosphate synthase type II
VALAAAAGTAGLVGGQADDLDSQSRKGNLSKLEAIHERKTGAMFQVALRLGGLVAEASADHKAALDRFGKRLGLAFQISDDLLDVRGHEAVLGKRVGKDDAHGKLTFPGLLGVDESLRRARLLVEEAREAVALFGSKAAKLDALARYVLERNH